MLFNCKLSYRFRFGKKIKRNLCSKLMDRKADDIKLRSFIIANIANATRVSVFF